MELQGDSVAILGEAKQISVGARAIRLYPTIEARGKPDFR
jgi:hypothetical protein